MERHVAYTSTIEADIQMSKDRRSKPTWGVTSRFFQEK